MSLRRMHGFTPDSPSVLRRRTTRRAALGLAAGGAIVVPYGVAMGQESPPIEPIGTSAPGEATDPITEPPQPTPTIPPDAPSAQIEQQAPSDGQYFAETGHNLGDPFLDTWIAAGGRNVLGVPLSEARFVGGVGQIQQTFETLTLAYDPQLDPASAIQGLLLDSAVVNRIAPESSRLPVNGAAGGDFFVETGHTLSGAFQAFWQQHGGIQLFGMPLSEPFASGSGTSQAFQKAVFDASADGTARLRRFGEEWVTEQGLAGDAAFIPAPPNGGVTSLVSASDGLRLRGGPSADAETLVVLPDNAEFIAAPGDHGAWVPGYVDGYAGWVSAEYLEAPPTVATIDVADWDVSVWQGAALGETNVRSEPTTGSSEVRVLERGDPVVVVDWVEGEEVFEGADVWAKLDNGTYIYARNVGRAAPVLPPPLPADAPWEGRWIDVQLTQQLLVAYEGRSPVRTAVVTTGMPGWETPTGWYAINRRVANETMESGAIGAEDFFKLEDVLFTQYFTDRGHALHFAWWRTPETIGRPGSHGCINMLLDDSRFLWDWATIGTPVIIRET